MANKKLNAVITIGGAVSSSLRSAFGTIKNETTKIGSALRNLEGQQRQLSSAISTFGKMGKNVDGLRSKYAAVTAEIEKTRRAQERMNKAGSGMQAGKSRMAGAGMALGATVAAAATAFVPVVQAASFETAMLGVAKQVAGARDESGKLTSVYYDMGKAIQQMGREIPIATNDLAAMVAAGARMGIAKDELIDFTKTAAMMASAFELPAAELADNMGKIAGLYKIPIPAIGELADSINFLDDNAISKGGDIIDFLTRTGGVAASVKVTGKEMAALGSTLLTMGERTETAGTAVNAMFSKLAAADKGSKKFKSAMKEIGLTTKSVQDGMQKDATGTLMRVMEAVGKLPAEKQLGVMVELVGLEHADTLSKLANNTGEYRRQLELVNSEAAKGSMGREFAAQLATTNAQWELMKNTMTEVSVNIGSVLLPPLNAAMKSFATGAGVVADFVRENQVLVGNIMTVVGTLGAIYAATQTFAFGVGLVTFAFNALKLAMMTNPIGVLLTVLAVGAVLIYKNWEPIKAFFLELWGSIKDGAQIAWDFVKNLWLDFTPLGLVVKNWEPIKGFFGALWADITASARTAMEWIIGKINAVGQVWKDTKSFFGFETAAPAAAAGASTGAPLPPVSLLAPPKIPPMATAMAKGAGAYTDQSQNTYQITQQPGENNRDLARRITEEQERQRQVKQRSAMTDGATSQ